MPASLGVAVRVGDVSAAASEPVALAALDRLAAWADRHPIAAGATLAAVVLGAVAIRERVAGAAVSSR